ncbi:50S ribosomal protein L32 [Diaphorobacter sp. JS3050]|nr:50S ribosomal protein L32 [Diaphorobacter sp. JS3050]
MNKDPSACAVQAARTSASRTRTRLSMYLPSIGFSVTGSLKLSHQVCVFAGFFF